MKKPLLFSTALIALDQAVKLIIFHLCPAADTVILPGVLFFRPVQNTDLSWIANMADYQAPVWLMVCLQILFLALVLVVYRYLVYFSENQKAYANGFLIFCLAGIICSFIDVVFWGGSLDFIRLLDWFTFDLKDVYLTVCIACVLPYAFSYLRTYRNTTAEERKEQGLWRWIKKGCPVSRSGLSDKPHEN